LSHGFSAKALQEQEPVLRGYIDQLIERLREDVRADVPTDMVKSYNLTTFDMIGDLAFGDSFGGLQNNRLHSWVTTFFNSVKVVSFRRAAVDYPLVFNIVSFFLPKSLSEARKRQIEYVENTVTKRLNNDLLHGRGDFIDSMNRHRGEKDGLSDTEIVANASVLVVGGSETTATLLSGVTYWLLRTPQALQKVVGEVRLAFKSEEEITFQNATRRLPYMLACLDEAFRMYPPVPAGLQRVTPAGEPTKISGYDIPPGVGL
jgi:cytochrome P450